MDVAEKKWNRHNYQVVNAADVGNLKQVYVHPLCWCNVQQRRDRELLLVLILLITHSTDDFVSFYDHVMHDSPTALNVTIDIHLQNLYFLLRHIDLFGKKVVKSLTWWTCLIHQTTCPYWTIQQSIYMLPSLWMCLYFASFCWNANLQFSL